MPEGRVIKGKWRCSLETFNQYVQDKILVVSREGSPNRKMFLSENEGQIVDTWLDEVATNEHASKEIEELFGTNAFFTAPKPKELIKYLVKFGSNVDSIILDFFAGSGTTGHAVLELNKEDGGNRQFILCTNNELNGFEKESSEQRLSEKEIQEYGICRRVTYPRIEKVIKGYKTPRGEKIDGLGGNLKYYKTSFVKRTISKDSLKIRITLKCTEMLCLREGIFDEKKKTNDYRVFGQNGRIMAVYYSLERSELKTLKKDLDKMQGDKILYCFTLDPLGLDKKDFRDWKGVSLGPIPQKILDVYESIYEY
jgi:adenine-specific DNA-methyltransferase